MLERGQADPGVIARIVNGRVLIRVDIYRNPTGPFARVTVLDSVDEMRLANLFCWGADFVSGANLGLNDQPLFDKAHSRASCKTLGGRASVGKRLLV
jgi:hypothetical protein